MLYETIRNDDFERNTALQYWNNVVTIRNNVVVLFGAKNRRCESSRVTSPLRSFNENCLHLIVSRNKNIPKILSQIS